MILRDLFYLARETVGAIHEGVSLGLRIVRDESPDRDEITHGPAWIAEPPLPYWGDGEYDDFIRAWKAGELRVVGCDACHDNHTSSTDGEIADGVTRADPPVDERPEAVSDIRPSAASGHPKLEWVAAWAIREWLSGEPCCAPTYFASIVRDLEELSQ